MSWSLELRGGDLTIGGTRLGQVTGSNKLVQDLRCGLLEPRGFDDLHPSFGSLIDGGLDESGNQIASIIGISDWQLAATRIDTEIRRVCSDQQRRQIERGKSDRYTYGESTLTNDELLYEVNDIQMTQAQDKMLVNVNITTGQGQNLDITVPFSNPASV